MARFSAETAVEMIGGNRFELVLAASQRSREIKNGSMQRVSGKDASPNVTALREIEQGKYTRNEWLSKIPYKKKGHRNEYFTTQG
jgi:DNA-directed RNA polymerase subunit omega